MDIRRKDRALHDKCEIEKIIKDARILHMGLYDDIYPYIVPMHFGYEYDENLNHYIFYMHGAKMGHKMDLIHANPHVCIEIENNVELEWGGENACSYSSYYASFIGRGTAMEVSDAVEKIHGLKLLMSNQTGRNFTFDEQMISSVAVIKVDIAEYTAKAKKKV